MPSPLLNRRAYRPTSAAAPIRRRWTDIDEEIDVLDAASIARFSEMAIRALRQNSSTHNRSETSNAQRTMKSH